MKNQTTINDVAKLVNDNESNIKTLIGHVNSIGNMTVNNANKFKAYLLTVDYSTLLVLIGADIKYISQFATDVLYSKYGVK